MSTQTNRYWFVSLEKLLQPGGAPLRLADSPLLDTDQPLENGSPLTLSLESFYVAKELDRKEGRNDLLVRSWTAYGETPPIEVVHFFKKNVGNNFVGENLAVEHMFAAPSYNDETIDITLQILEVDGHPDIATEIKIVSHVLGAVFPVVLPFASLAAGLYQNLKHIFDNPSDLAFFSSLKLYSYEITKQYSTYRPLRCGAYVFFEEEVDGRDYLLQDLKVESVAGDRPIPSYGVIKLIPKVINSRNQDDLLANQKLAASLLRQNEAESLMLPSQLLNAAQQKADSFKLLRNAAAKAKIMQDLAEYRRLRLLDEAGGAPNDSNRYLPDQDEQFNRIVQTLKNYFKTQGAV